jgi:hypothetical protein
MIEADAMAGMIGVIVEAVVAATIVVIDLKEAIAPTALPEALPPRRTSTV